MRVVVPALVLAVLVYIGFRGAGPAPPLGPLLDPVRGIWAVALQRDLPPARLTIPGITDTVRVVFDDRGVPHIFAYTVEDAARALGYVHARFRLFQLELQARVVGGRLTEWFGPDALPMDREQRSLGLGWSAEREASALDTTSEAARVVLAYAEGVNARLAELASPQDLPFEYRLLNVRPERWRPLYTFYLIKRMGYTLSYVPQELSLAELERAVGPELARALMPVNAPIQEPIVPSSRRTPALDPVALPGPERMPAAARQRGSVAGAWQGAHPLNRPTAHPPEASNNWVVSGKRSATGYPLLAGDPHLDLSLPSIWFEAHLVVPGRLDVYGVTFLGAPAVAIGFNREVAWSFTNTGADVLDFYAERLDDSVRPRHYRLDGEWRPLESRVEQHRGRGGRLLATDTTYFTHRGPVRREDGRTLSMRWTMLDADGALEALWGIGSTWSVDEWLAVWRRFRAPIQNGVVADRRGDIAVLSAGAYPVRPGGGDGLGIRDGTTSASDWQGYLEVARYPYARNPDQGYFATANQQPVDPATDPFYYGADWPSPWRAMRINRLLRSDSSVTADEMRAFQTDPGSARADWFLPVLLEAVAREGAAGRAPDDAIAAARLLADWDGRYTLGNERAVLFEETMRALGPAVWDELVARDADLPSGAVLAALLSLPDSPWWDDQRTPDRLETRDAALAGAVAEGYRRTVGRYGSAGSGGWRWDRVRHANIWHLLRIPALSALEIPVQGGPGLLNPSEGSGTHGPSWRMVVEVGPEVRAWGAYPGGQSGNPVSRWYRDRLGRWAAGELDPLPFPATPDALPAEHIAGVTVMLGAAR
jgi:penicillin amidase